MGLFGKPDANPAAKPGDGSATPPAAAGTQEGAAPATPSTPPAKASTAKPIAGLAIRAIPTTGFFRAGRRWLPEVQTVALSEFTKAQVKALREETNLSVEDVEITPEQEA